ncbi:hypothetical protein [Pseudomonas fluvialis]|uniref:hypothetical protein n=1 Tax=Pseudomonas fluvialis TaxID=1793966 RepID=UPI0035ADB1B7
MSEQDNLVKLHEKAPQRALQGLRRVTGVAFSRWPLSLREWWRSQEQEKVELPDADEHSQVS